MNYDADEFSSIWSKVVLPTTKSAMNLLRSRYVVAFKNQVICSKLYILLDVPLLAIINMPIASMPHVIHIVLVMDSTKFVNGNSTVTFSLDEQFMATMIAKKCKGDFDTYFFVIDNLIKNANAKGYNRHVATCAMQLSELLSVGQEALGLLLLDNYREPWKQLME